MRPGVARLQNLWRMPVSWLSSIPPHSCAAMPTEVPARTSRAAISPPLLAAAKVIRQRLRRQKVRLTLGGEPTYVPDNPEGTEWSFVAVGPTKLHYAYAFAGELITRYLPGAVTVYSPGKQYPGETNPRWVVNVLANRDGSPIAAQPPVLEQQPPTKRPRRTIPKAAFQGLQALVCKTLHVPRRNWIGAREPTARGRQVAVLPLDHNSKRWISDKWKLPGGRTILPLIDADGPAGLRLPLDRLPEKALRRALTLEWRDQALHLFMPPLLQAPFQELLSLLLKGLAAHKIDRYYFEGYLPPDVDASWMRLGLTADPGVLEVNLPPCENWEDYHDWLARLEEAGAAVGLRSWKLSAQGDAAGTGGGNHLIFGGPSLEENPFFTRPAWVASLLRYFQAHPCLAYLFTGSYVGASSQAPRPDESARDLYDLDLAYQYLASLPAGDHRYLIGETLRHMHIDMSGNTHRSEISFDKFWMVNGPPSGASGLIEFRAIESLPHARWMSAIALLWQAIALYTLEHETPAALAIHGSALHDRYFLATPLWNDLQTVLGELRAGGIDLPDSVFREIWEWRFPRMLAADFNGANLEIRRVCESWPLLCETPSEGGSMSRFVDTSIERLEFCADARFADSHRVFVNGRELILTPLTAEDAAPAGCGLRYRRTALFPSLHPGIEPHLPLELIVTRRKGTRPPARYILQEDRREFVTVESDTGSRSSPGKPAAESGSLPANLRPPPGLIAARNPNCRATVPVAEAWRCPSATGTVALQSEKDGCSNIRSAEIAAPAH